MSKHFHVAVITLLVLGAALVVTVVSLGSASKFKYVIGPTSCMAPTINSGELIFGRSFDYRRSLLKRYEIVVFRAPMQVTPAGIWLMRVVGLPREQVEVRTNGLLINGFPLPKNSIPVPLRGRQWLTVQGYASLTNRSWTLGPEEIFVVGDNLAAANDSRFWGGLALSNITGVVEDKAKAKQFQLTLKPVFPVSTAVAVQDGQKEKVN